MTPVGSFVALGDGATAGVGDGPCRSAMADRFAERLASRNSALLYANLAVSDIG